MPGSPRILLASRDVYELRAPLVRSATTARVVIH